MISRTFEDSESNNETNAAGNELTIAAEMFGDGMAEDCNDKVIMEEDVSMKDSAEENMSIVDDNKSENINNETRELVYIEFDEDGQRYLLMNKIIAVIVRKRSEENELSNISVTVVKHCLSITFETNYNFTCCDMNSNGILFDSTHVDNIKESIVKYKQKNLSNWWITSK